MGLRSISAWTTQRIFDSSAARTTGRLYTTGNNPITDTWKKAAIVGTGFFGSIVTPNVVYAKDHNNNAEITHAAQHILEHAIWHSAGHYALHLGSFASTMLGGLLSFQTLGEEEGFYISKTLQRPSMIKCFNSATGMMDDCLVLPNGRQLVGQEILQFCQDLQFVQIVESLAPGKRL